MISTNIQKFLLSKIEEEKLSRKELAEKCDITYSTMHKLLHASLPKTSLTTVIRISNAFDTSVDNILGRDKLVEENQFNKSIDDKQFSKNLRNFIILKLEKEQEKPTHLSNSLGFSFDTINEFISTPPKKNSLGSNIILKLADHWQVSIDEMIGRASPSKENNISVEQTQNQALDAKLSKDDLSALKNIKANLKAKVSDQPDVVKNTSTKPKSFVERLQQERTSKKQKLER